MSAPTQNLPAAEEGGQEEIDLSSFSLGLMNTVLFENISPNFRASISSQKRHIEASDIVYGDGSKKPQDLPKSLDTREISGFPEEDRGKWFYRDADQNWQYIITYPLDQAGCGSCWAFSSASQFSDVIRFNLLRLYGQDACKKSAFFRPNIICTGETNVATSAGVTNPKAVRVYAEETYVNISTYFTVAFSPKIKLASAGNTTVLDLKCNDVLEEWKSTIATAGRKPGDLKKILSADYEGCMGCGGNLIICPLMLFTGATEEARNKAEGAPVAADFALHEWACLWGQPEVKANYCSEQFLSGIEVRDFPHLYKADYYSYISAAPPPGFKTYTIPSKIKSQGINTFEEWMRMAIYFYGPISIGFSVYNSFLSFFSKKENAKKIYTAKQLAGDYRLLGGKNKKALGGHAVVLIGWSETTINGQVVPYWIMRNSWGLNWADQGMCYVERGIDAKLQALNVPIRMQIEYEFGNLYFAPFPNPTLTMVDKKPYTNDMKDFLMPIPAATAPAFFRSEKILDQMTKQCNCRCGTDFNFTTNQCELQATPGIQTSLSGPGHIPNASLAGSSFSLGSHIAGAHVDVAKRPIYAIVFILFLILACGFVSFLVYEFDKRRAREFSTARHFHCQHWSTRVN